MIQTPGDFQKAKEKLDGLKSLIEQQKETLEKQGLSNEQIEQELQSSFSSYEQLKQDVDRFEQRIDDVISRYPW